MTWDPAAEPSARPRAEGIGVDLALDDEGSFFELLLMRPEMIGSGVVFFADARVVVGSESAWPIALGWRREGGPVLLALTTGAASEALVVEALQLAGATAAWPLARWDEAVRGWWEQAPPELRARLAERWGLRPDAELDVATWTGAAWDGSPAPGRAAIGIVATRIPEPIARAVDWLAMRAAAAAFAIRWYGPGATPAPRLDLVAGAWEILGEAGGPAEAWPEAPAVEPVPRGSPEAPASAAPPAAPAPSELPAEGERVVRLMAAIEARCREIGCRVSRRADWIRFDGPGRSLRVFPGAGWADLQLVGISEGALVGLRYRYGVPLSLEPLPGAPPGVHVRLPGPDLDPGAAALLAAWLSEPGERPRAKATKPAPAPRRPRNASRPRDPRGRRPKR